MPLMGVVEQGTSIDVVFESDASTNGVSAIALTWIPFSGGHVPPTEIKTVDAGGPAATWRGVAVPESQALQLDVNVPDGMARCTLTVKRPGKPDKTDTNITADVTWLFSVE